jgi:hypothetical protein
LQCLLPISKWQANKFKLVMDRFDRRWAIYQAIIDFIVAVCRDFNVKPEDIGTFRRATVQAEFLFGPEIPTYIDELCSRSLKLREARSKARDLTQPIPPGYDHQRVTDVMHAAEQWFVDLLDQRSVNQKFKKYLDISH